MGKWTLNVGNMKIDFMTTSSGVLGVKFNSSKESGIKEVYAPLESNQPLKKFNYKKPTKDFYGTFYGENHLMSDEIVRKWYDKEKPEVFITKDEMNKMYPLTKEGKVISKKPISQLNLKNISASDGYYLLPVKDYENIQKYKKLVEFLGDDFILTNPIRLRVASVTEHNYAIFVDKSKNAVVMVEVLVKAGMQPEPEL